MKINIAITVYEKNGKEGMMDHDITVRSHWNRDELVVLIVGDQEYTVSASDLENAVKRCSGWR